MDYNNFSKNPDYFGLVRQFDKIVNVLVLKLKQLKTEGFDPKNGYMYGFSYGSHLVAHGALNAFGSRTLGMIDGEMRGHVMDHLMALCLNNSV
jgi:hypothetical protein